MSQLGNTVGSLTEIQSAIILGSVLGDGYLSCKTNAYLKIGHSLKQKQYVDWKYSFLSPLVHLPPTAYKGNGERVGYRFWTKSLPELTRFYQLFYGKTNSKHIPDSLLLSPLALAVWFMDDGAQNRKSVYLNTQQFTFENQMKLLQVLESQFGLKGSLNKDKKYFRIRLYQESAQKLPSLIKPLMPSCMHYKLPL